MSGKWAPVLVLVVLGGALAGCLGGDDDPVVEGSVDAEGEGLATIQGRVFTTGLEPISGAFVALVQGADILLETRSDETGQYLLAGVASGEYRLQFSAACCRQDVKHVIVTEGDTLTVDVQLGYFTAEDLAVPYVEEFQWVGMLNCAGALIVVAGDPCGLVIDEEYITSFELREGLRSVTMGLVWRPTGDVLGEQLGIGMHHETCSDNVCDISDPDDTYGYTSGPPGTILQVHSPGGRHSFDNIEDTRIARIMVLPRLLDIGVFYQQEFTVYYHLHYHQRAPDDYDPIPDL